MDLRRYCNRIWTVIGGLMLSDGLRARAVRGGAWLGAGSIAEQTARFARNMVLTRLLAPSAFGAMAIVMSSSAIIGSLTEVGHRDALIQNARGGEDAYLNAGWWMGMSRALCMYVVIFVMAPLVGHFYGNAELCALLRVTLLGTLFDGAASPRSILPQKQMRFGRWIAISNGGGICGVIVTVMLSFWLHSVWALAIGSCSESLCRCLLSYILCPGLPFVPLNRDVLRDLYKFSKGVVGLPFLNLIFSRTDVFVLGKLYSTTTLGLYTMAVLLVQTPSSFFTTMMGQTLFTTVAHVQNEKERVSRILVQITSWLTMLGIPGVAAIYLCRQSILTLIYGGRYAVAAGPLAMAASVVFLNVINAAITCVFNGLGRPALHRRAVAASAVAMLILIYPACKMLGMVGGQVAALLAITISYVLQLIRIRSIIGLDLLSYGKSFVPASLGSVAMAGIVLGVRHIGLVLKPIADISLCFGTCFILYAICAAVHLHVARRQDSLSSAARESTVAL